MATANGMEWVRQRIESLPTHLRHQLDTSLPKLPPDLKTFGVLATGVGSSEAAARYLVYLCNRIGITAEFQPLSYFYGKIQLPHGQKPYLVVFSQGLSPNSGIVLKQRHHFSGTILFTSSTPEGQRAEGKPDRAELLESLAEEGASIILHPMQNEYDILPRFVGPLCAFFSVSLLMEKISPGCLGGMEQLRAIPDILETIGIMDIEGWVADLQSGLSFWFTHAGSQHAQNLSCKILETLFISPPLIGDVLSYSHGPFQLNIQDNKPAWIFTSGDPVEQQLLQRLLPLYKRAGPCKIITSPLPPALSIFYYEAFLNHLLLEALKDSSVDLVNWPGKGEDSEGYSINSPGSQPEQP
jgi:hypothetical protein